MIVIEKKHRIEWLVCFKGITICAVINLGTFERRMMGRKHFEKLISEQ